jgi:hypothetical protein
MAWGAHRRPLDLDRDRTVLLFFEDVEQDVLVRNDRYLRRTLRKLYHTVKSGQTGSGFGMAFTLLRRALEQLGYQVVVNDHRQARDNPAYPVGIAGYPHVLQQWTLPNPAVLGPGLLDHPGLAPALMQDPRFRSYLVPSEWTRALFAKVYGSRCALWSAGIDLGEWPNYAAEPKDIDFLVYDKIRWDREGRAASLVRPLLARLEERGLNVKLLRYGTYSLREYRELLRRTRGMIFLSEHETQGIAYQEAMACNVPILAWVNGYWVDPQRSQFEVGPIAATSVPLFSDQCGETFAGADDFGAALDRFLARRGSYRPRRYVAENLSLEISGQKYLEHYRSASR